MRVYCLFPAYVRHYNYTLTVEGKTKVPRTPMTPEKRAEQSEKMKQRWAEKKAQATQNKNGDGNAEAPQKQNTDINTPEVQTSQSQEPAVVLSQEQFDALMKRIADVEATSTKQTPEQAIAQTAKVQGVQLTPGGIQGIQYKYPVDKGFYPDPTERLYNEPELKRYAMRENYLFTWDVDGVMYEKYNITYSEPKFTVQLRRKIFDDEGEYTGKNYIVGTAIMHEDEMTTRIVADKLGILDKFTTFEDLMNEVRYLRFRRWVMETFFPNKIVARHNEQLEMVIDGKVVTMVSDENFVEADSAEGLSNKVKGGSFRTN